MAVAALPRPALPGAGRRANLNLSPRMLSALVALAAVLCGALMAYDVRAGVALLIGLVYAAIALLNVEAALVLFVPLTFLEGLPLLNAGGKAAGALVAVAWVGTMRSRRENVGTFVRRHKALAAVLVGMLLWFTLSIAWAVHPGVAAADLWHWYSVVLVMLVVATTATSVGTVRGIVVAFVVGAVLSVVSGVFGGALADPTAANETAESGRLAGGAGDPNYLAAALPGAIFCAAALAATIRVAAVRLWLSVAAVVMALGLVASESRGGIIAAGVTVLAALVVFRRFRGWVVSGVLVGAASAVVFFTLSPSSLQRITEFNDGSGRSDIWRVAWRVTLDRPVLGAGLANFPDVAKRYVAEPGSLKSLALIVDRPRVAHNVYLQFSADTGIVGLLLFLALAGLCLRAAAHAATVFRQQGDVQAEALAQAVLVALIGMLAAFFFISHGVDRRLWILFALGPALAAVAADPRRRLPAT